MNKQQVSIIKGQKKPSLGMTSIPPVQQFLQAARHCKLDILSALEQAGIELTSLYRTDARISGEQFQQLLVYLIEHCQHPLFGLYSARFIQPDRFYILGQIGLNSNNVSQAIMQAMPLEQLVGDMGITELREHPHGLKMVWHCQYSHPLVIPHLIDNVLASWVNYARFLLEDSQASPIEIKLQRSLPTPSEVKQYQTLFACPVLFEQNENAILISKNLLMRPLPSGDKHRLPLLMASAKQRLDHIDKADQLQLAVARVIRQLLPQGKINREQIAEQLHLTGRTLQRKLLKQGISYQTLVDNIRHEMADYWLTCSELSAAEIALELGYSDVSVFFRAYKLWTGHTPRLKREILKS
ncbi:AraC family transcriptional regulator [Shewanella sp. D64]|uniref:AraC family transcriptional regulator n=1 Tax=unclassified Shewanella TaxID=196818 RepID=UPI0022BA3FAA|nr:MULTISPECIES: AraC family transcriptional regulator [unclassified Shewanella]MEC4725499.1 AraC family transcriptional regulator [Shewanella sp. D64]MEC4738682.1 AraC family transcriptional regulator [Shewanella sp. E94]WBJ94978.1 AraC family transcriptional regulator [Shewanella sp. MTB7]